MTGFAKKGIVLTSGKGILIVFAKKGIVLMSGKGILEAYTQKAPSF